MRIAAGILLFLIAQLLTTVLGFALGLPLTPLPFFIGLLAVFFYRVRDPLGAALVIAVVAICLLLSALFRDFSWDGIGYHREAFQQLVAGWNPLTLYQPLNTQLPEYSQWLGFFTKANWYSGAIAFQIFGSLNVTKYGALLLLVPAGAIAFEAFKTRITDRRLAIAFALVWVLNPIALYQLFTNYVDGQLGTVIAALIALLLIDRAARRRDWYIAFGCAFILLMNIKLSGAVYGAIIIGGWLIIETVRRRFDRAAWLTAIAAGLLGVCIGWNPFITQYVANTVAHGAPFYPTTYDKLTSIDYNLPISLQNQGMAGKAIISLFSRTDAYKENESRYKIPFTFDVGELSAIAFWDVRIGGFGVWFSGILIVSAIGLLIGVRKIPESALIVSGLLLLSVLSNPELWWARYVPQLWLIPVMIAASLVNETQLRRVNPRLIVAGVLTVALVGNVLLTGIPVLVTTIGWNIAGKVY